MLDAKHVFVEITSHADCVVDANFIVDSGITYTLVPCKSSVRSRAIHCPSLQNMCK